MVFVQELDQEKSRVIKELFNSDAVVIKPSEGPIKPTITNCDPGGQVAVYFGTNFKGYASVAFGAKDANGKLGLVSCGHDLSIGDTVYAVYPGEKIGTITKLKFSDNCDASFIEISNPNYTTSPRLHFQNTARITNVIFSTLPEGTAVAAYPNEFKYGKIISNNGWGFVGLTVITDMYKIDFPLAKGDSGCPLLYENKKGSEYSLIGQTTGTGVSGGCFVKFANVYSSLGLSWYHIQP